MRVYFGFFAALVFTLACSGDGPQTPDDPLTGPTTLDAVAQTDGGIPARTRSGRSDSALWDAIVSGDSLAILGIKAPGAVRGIWKADWLISRQDARSYFAAVSAIPGVAATDSSSRLPAVLIRLTSLRAVETLLQFPFIDYLEPAFLESAGGDTDAGSAAALIANSSGSQESSSCSFGSPRSGGTTTIAGDRIGSIWAEQQIPQAWKRANGSGVVLGLTDTGVSYNQDELGSDFATSYSMGRWQYKTNSIAGGGHDGCGHGTRMAGVMAAPTNGVGVAGVAWGAHLVSVRQADDVIAINSWDAAQAINTAAAYRGSQYDRRVIAMAWQSNDGGNYVSDMIRSWYHDTETEVLFVAASGTSGWGTGSVPNVIFPAEMGEVIAVSLVDYVPTDPDEPYHSITSVHYGDPVEMAAISGAYATGEYTGDVVSLGGSSSGSAVVAGIAALAWSEYPWMTNDQLRQHLRESSHAYPTRIQKYGFGVLDALKAVGGMWDVSIDTELLHDAGYYQTWRVTANPVGGDGPYTYDWDHGETAKSFVMSYRYDELPPVYHVDVTDTSDGVTQRKGVSFNGLPPHGGECDPSDLIC